MTHRQATTSASPIRPGRLLARRPPPISILPAEVAPASSCSRRIRSPVSILIHPIRPRPRPRISPPRPPLPPRAEVAPGVLLLPPHRRSPN
uniref:Uncharacterized protein n=1 Tax=Oryza rufipogon TaxID=4529 RepID=A0A0E0NB58_ORYRU